MRKRGEGEFATIAADGEVMASGRSSEKLGELPMPAKCVRSRDDGGQGQKVEADSGACMQGGTWGKRWEEDHGWWVGAAQVVFVVRG